MSAALSDVGMPARAYMSSAVVARADVTRSPAAGDEPGLLDALRRGDEAAFVELVERHSAGMLRLARVYAGNAAAEEVVQETWLAVLEGLPRFEGRSSVKTWMFRILTNIAAEHARRGHRCVAFSAMSTPRGDRDEPARAVEWTDAAWHAGQAGSWSTLLPRADAYPEERLLAWEVRMRVRSAIDSLPPQQRSVILLRDVEGWSADEVCDALGLSPVNQRVLLHRARSSVRQALDVYLTRE